METVKVEFLVRNLIEKNNKIKEEIAKKKDF